MRVVCIQHVDFETPGIIEDWAKLTQHSFQIFKPYVGEELPDEKDLDCVISMGGPQSPGDASQFSYLQAELELLQKAIQSGKKVLGFCLGAQLIGEALGGKTEKSPEKEIGVFPITLTDDAKKDPLFHDFPSTFPVIHWHNDMPGQTKESILLASSAGCPFQAYRYRPQVYGLQFHLEITKKGIEDLIEHAPHDLYPSLYTQTRQDLLTQDYDSINQRIPILLERLLGI